MEKNREKMPCLTQDRGSMGEGRAGYAKDSGTECFLDVLCGGILHLYTQKFPLLFLLSLDCAAHGTGARRI